MKLPALLLVVGLALAAGVGAWALAAATAPPPRPGAGERALAQLAPALEVELGAPELVDPRTALPRWHTLDRALARALASGACPPTAGPAPVLRALTHELRTPATSLRLDLEALRQRYDELPAAAQEAVLRAVDDVERLDRVLSVSARALELFEGPAPFAPEELPSLASALEGALEGEQVEYEADGPVRTDPRWLRIAVRIRDAGGARRASAVGHASVRPESLRGNRARPLATQRRLKECEYRRLRLMSRLEA